MDTRIVVATNSTRGLATNSTRVLPICRHLNSSSDRRKARTATIL